MGRIAYFVILVAMMAGYTATFGQNLSSVDAVCLLNKQAPHTVGKISVPFGAQHERETVWRKTAPDNFHAVLALMQAVAVAPCDLESGQEARVHIRAMRLIERDPATGKEAVVSEATGFGSEQSGETTFGGELFPRIPGWYQGASSQPEEGMLTREDSSLVIDLGKAPRFIYHGWTDPKASAKPGMNYLVEMEVKIVGTARLQMGIDYWRDTASAFNGFDGKCERSNNCEGYLSRWFGPTDGWQTIRVPDAFVQ